MNVRRLALVVVLLLPVLAACSTTRPGTGDSSVSLALDWYPNSDHAGLYMAKEHGYFAAQGLNVNMYTPSNPDDVLQLVGTGKATFGVSYEPDLLLARAQGVPVVSIAALVQHPLNSVISLKSSGITRPSQLAGKKVGTPGLAGDEAMLATMMAKDGGSLSQLQLVNVGFNLVPALVSKKVDAIIGGYWSHEAILVAQQGDPVNVMHVENWGVPDYYELVLVASESTVKNQPQLVQRMVNAVVQGYAAAISNPTAALDAVQKNYPEMDRKMETVAIQDLVPLFKGNQPKPGWQTADRWQNYEQWMVQHKLLTKPIDASAAFTNRFVAAAP
ncbi:MAG TPA: ABC transporter substrate-binding protein [Thermomicrobiaceae bacterium]|nr:ABC transporter substrate-binding protein [Thermomicrobiaceae bacterium]